jgi:hypothetical protein
MTTLNRCQAALRIFGDELVPEELSRLFNHPYTKGWVKGHEFTSSSGSVVVKKTGTWILEGVVTESGDFDGQISRLLACVDLSLQQWISLASRFESDIFCGWFMRDTNEGISVSPGTMRMLAERNITLSVDIYAPLDDAAG